MPLTRNSDKTGRINNDSSTAALPISTSSEFIKNIFKTINTAGTISASINSAKNKYNIIFPVLSALK